jgi:hypothetical protein
MREIWGGLIVCAVTANIKNFTSPRASNREFGARCRFLANSSPFLSLERQKRLTQTGCSDFGYRQNHSNLPPNSDFLSAVGLIKIFIFAVLV